MIWGSLNNSKGKEGRRIARGRKDQQHVDNVFSLLFIICVYAKYAYICVTKSSHFSLYHGLLHQLCSQTLVQWANFIEVYQGAHLAY